MKQLVTILKERLTDELEEVSTVDINWGQLSGEPLSRFFPCVLIDLEKVTFSQQRNGYQLAEADIRIVVADSIPDEDCPDEINPLQLYGLIENAHNSLQQFSDGNFAPLCRTSMEKTENDGNYHGYTITYQTNYTIPFDDGRSTIPLEGIEDINIEFI